MAILQDIDKLKGTRWFAATVERHGLHVGACRELGVEPEPLEIFAAEVLNTPEVSRDWLLKLWPIENYEPFMQFAQYQTPRVEEMALGFSGRKK